MPTKKSVRLKKASPRGGEPRLAGVKTKPSSAKKTPAETPSLPRQTKTPQPKAKTGNKKPRVQVTVPTRLVKEKKPFLLDKYFASGWRPRFTEYLLIALLLLSFGALTKRLGQADILGDQGLGAIIGSVLPAADILYYVGSAMESYFPLIVAFLLAFAAAKRPNAAMGLAVLATWAGYVGATTALSKYSGATIAGQSAGVNLGFFGGLLVGGVAAVGWTTFRFRKVTSRVSLISGIPLVVLLCATGGVVLGILVGVLYQLLYLVIVLGLGWVFLNLPGPISAALYALLHPFAEVTGMGDLLDIVPFRQYGSCQTPAGDTLVGSYNCFIYGGTQLEGQQALFLAGGYPVVGFGLTAFFILLWLSLKGESRQYWAILYWLLALATFLAGSDQAALYLFAVAAPPLLVAHALASALSYGISAILQVTIGWAGGAGIVDLLRWFSSGQGLAFVLILGVVFAALYVMLGLILVVNSDRRWINLGGYGIPAVSKPFMSLVAPPQLATRAQAKRSESVRKEPPSGETEAQKNAGVVPLVEDTVVAQPAAATRMKGDDTPLVADSSLPAAKTPPAVPPLDTPPRNFNPAGQPPVGYPQLPIPGREFPAREPDFNAATFAMQSQYTGYPEPAAYPAYPQPATPLPGMMPPLATASPQPRMTTPPAISGIPGAPAQTPATPYGTATPPLTPSRSSATGNPVAPVRLPPRNTTAPTTQNLPPRNRG